MPGRLPFARRSLPSASAEIQGNCIKPKTPLQLKKAEKLIKDARLEAALAHAKKVERAADAGPMKRRDNDYLSGYIAPSRRSAIRAEDGYRAKSYNLSRQIFGLVDHLFVRYRVPMFLYRSVLSRQGLELLFEVPATSAKLMKADPPEAKYRPWFFAVAQGQSFAKASKDVFTKREAHWFLLAPTHNSIERNIFWAKLAATDLDRAGCDYLAEKLDPEFLEKVVGDRLPDLIRFYVEAWPQMRGYDRDEITDFVRAAAQNSAFSFKGRTFGSMRKLCHEWHGAVYSGRVREYQSWIPGIPLWEHRKGQTLVRAEELTNNRALNDEGKVQRHCVFTYTSYCLQGRTRIASLRWFVLDASEAHPSRELSRLTVEIHVAHRTIQQIRGRLNRRATGEEMKVLRMWAGEMGFTIQPHA